jgi:CO/xanthine dehydrogenase FAD-binding subunit
VTDPASQVLAPRDLTAALSAIAGDRADVVAGGTDFMVEVNFGRRTPSSVVSLHAIDELRAWTRERDELVLGAAITCATLERPPFTDLVPALAQAARTVGSPQIRAAATIGGNLGTASPAGDLLPVLSALDASVTCASRKGSRIVPIHDFLLGPKRNALESGELVTSVRVPVLGRPQEFVKVGTRNAMVIAVASVAVVAADGGVRIALGAVGPTVLRAHRAEAWFGERGHDPAAAVELGRRVAAEARPIDDHRSTAEYRRHAIAICAARAGRRIYGPGREQP